MLKRFRQLRISLAAKFQLLFGIAVAMIIGMALLVPWWRMEEPGRRHSWQIPADHARVPDRF